MNAMQKTILGKDRDPFQYKTEQQQKGCKKSIKVLQIFLKVLKYRYIYY